MIESRSVTPRVKHQNQRLTNYAEKNGETIMELLEKILSKDNLNEAYLAVYRNKGSAGVDGVTVDELLNYLKINGETIKEQIRNRKYRPQPVKRVEIPKENGKVRKLGIPTVVDRVIQQAMNQVLSPIFEEQFSNSSFGFRVGKSCEMAITRSLELLNDGYDWIVDIDLERFFDTVNQDRLLNLVSGTIKDNDVISLVRWFLNAGVMTSNGYEDTEFGVPQGGNLSPLLSNIMLNELDKELEARNLNFVRYADDCNIYVRSEKAAERVMKSVVTFIENKLGLIVNAQKSKIGRPKDIKFLGFGYFHSPNEKKYQAKPHEKSIQKFKRKLKQLTKRRWSISLDLRLKKIKQVVVGWINYFRIGKMKTFLGVIDAKIRQRVRVVIWKQWKTPDKRIKSLVQLGIDKEQAKGLTWCRKGYQFIGKSCVVHRAISNERLKKRGLIFGLDHFLKVHIS